MLNKTRILALCVMATLFSVIATQAQHLDTDWRDDSADRAAAAAGGDFDLSCTPSTAAEGRARAALILMEKTEVCDEN